MSITSDRLRDTLQRKNMKQKELSQLTGIGEANICNYVSGRYAPKMATVEKMAKALGVSAMWLQGWSDIEHEQEESIQALIDYDLSFADKLKALLSSYDEFDGHEFTDDEVKKIMKFIRVMIVEE